MPAKGAVGAGRQGALEEHQRGRALRISVIVGMLVVISAMHYLTTLQHQPAHDIYRRLYYLPIVLGLWFTLRGGIATAVATSLLFLTHVVFQWGHHPVAQPEQYLEILLYNVIGGLTGFLAGRELEQKQAHQLAAQQLAESYRTLSTQADQILEIEEQLRRADRLSTLGELSAGLAHEIPQSPRFDTCESPPAAAGPDGRLALALTGLGGER